MSVINKACHIIFCNVTGLVFTDPLIYNIHVTQLTAKGPLKMLSYFANKIRINETVLELNYAITCWNQLSHSFLFVLFMSFQSRTYNIKWYAQQTIWRTIYVGITLLLCKVYVAILRNCYVILWSPIDVYTTLENYMKWTLHIRHMDVK